MTAQSTPMRWPDTWTDPSSLDLLKAAAIDYLLIGNSDALEPVRARARQAGLQVSVPPAISSPVLSDAGASVIKGEWPGVRLSRGAAAQATAGPTGVPWVDSNGWLIRLESARRPETSIWI